MRKIAVLRGINVGGIRKLLMADLRMLLEELGYSDVTTYIQSGNVAFNSDTTHSNLEISSEIEKAINDKYGYDVPVILRDSLEIEAAIKSNPFLNESVDTKKLHLTFLSKVPDDASLENILSYDFSPDSFKIIGDNVFLKIEGKYHETKLSNNFFETKLKVRATNRNWNTVVKLWEMGGIE